MTDVQAATAGLPKIQYTTAIPDSARGGGRVAGAGENLYKKLMTEMPAPAKSGKAKDAPMQFAWFFVAADKPADTITDPKEREKEIKANQQKLVNRFTSIGRRIRKEHADTHDFTYRKMTDPAAPDGTGEPGLVVYRIEPAKATPAA